MGDESYDVVEVMAIYSIWHGLVHRLTQPSTVCQMTELASYCQCISLQA